MRGKHKVSNDTKLNDFSPGQKITTIDSATLQQYQLQSLANVLTQQVPVFVKSYGFNGLATLNFRGASSAQSAVYWNGVPIQNAALGVADVSTMPAMLMSKVHLVYGGSSAMWGSGNVGGALVVENEAPVFDTGRVALSVSAGAGSFGQYLGGLKASRAGRRWYTAANLFCQTAANDFRYANNQGAQQRIGNSRLSSAAGLVQAAYKISDSSTFTLSAWAQTYSREIPETLTDLYSVKKQVDNSVRLLAGWEQKGWRDNRYARFSFIRDEIHYRDSAVAIRSDNIVHQYFHEVGWKRQVGTRGQLLVFSPTQVSWLAVQEDVKYQSRVALAVAYDHKLFGNRLDIAASARAEAINEKIIFLPGLNASFLITDWLSVKANVQRTYRAPTLNELYYFPGGNLGLKPEQGWSGDAGYVVRLRSRHITIAHELSVYNRNIKDWIIWLGNAVWTPYNIAEVRSRGVETDNKLVYTHRKWQAHLGIATSYVLATTVASYAYNDGSIGKQIPYTPRYNARLNIGAGYGPLYLNYNHTYTGYRFFTTDESAYLVPYQTGNLQLMYTGQIARHVLQLTAQVNNLWNERYQVVANRPMPGVNWLAGIKLVF
ncbi:MAG: TonB-dependent receptor [Bacteroidota bacterium]